MRVTPSPKIVPAVVSIVPPLLFTVTVPLLAVIDSVRILPVAVRLILPPKVLRLPRFRLAPDAVILPLIAIVSPLVILTVPAPLLSASAVRVREPMELEKFPRVLSVKSAIVMLLVAAKETLELRRERST